MRLQGLMNEKPANDHEARRRALNETAARVVNRVLGCWQHDLSRPFSNKGRTYRVCLKCGMSREFDSDTWKTYGHYQQSGPQLLYPKIQTAQCSA